MSLLIVQDLSLSYGKKALFEGASFSIGPSDRIGLVGANGTGKSTLLKILVGEVTPDRVNLTWRRRAFQVKTRSVAVLACRLPVGPPRGNSPDRRWGIV